MSKNDLDQGATKGDIQRLEQSTKTDIARLEKGMKKFATKTELKHVGRSLRSEILRVEARVENLEDGQKRLEGKIDKLTNITVNFVGRLDSLETDHSVAVHHTRELDKRVTVHDKQISELESALHVS